MNDKNLLILTVYLICVTYVFYRMIKSIDKQLDIQLDRDYLDIQLEAQGLKDIIALTFKLKEQYEPEQLRELPIIIENKSEVASISIDWDRSSLTDFDERGRYATASRTRRVIRLIPGMTPDLLPAQVVSVIAPEQALKESITAEDVLQRNALGTLEIASPLFNPDKLQKAAEKSDRLVATQSHRFSLRLMLQVHNPNSANPVRQSYALSCEFIVNKLPWTQALGWKPQEVERD